mgnify:CR=1 FL=1
MPKNKHAKELQLIREKLLERKPERFSSQDIVRAFFGALLIGITFVFAPGLVQVARALSWAQLAVVIVMTWLLLFIEIYFVGWSRVRGERGRALGEFTLKRLPTFYLVALMVSVFYTFLFGFQNWLAELELLKMLFVMAMPCSFGAAIADLLRTY